MSLRRRLSTRVRYFWSKVSKQSVIDCWAWTGSVNYKGYASFGNTFAHRFSYALYVGPLDPALVLDHLCRNRSCVNPRHLEQVTMRENYRRGHHWAALGLCKRGHAMTPHNTYTFQSGAKGEMRTCLICRMVSRRRWINRKRHGSLQVHTLRVAS